MSRIKSRAQIEICGDCGASDPSWASINRGILLCAECCSIHRSLGRHISQVKSLRQGSWSPAVLNYVNAINAHGANSVWEHCLMDAVAPKNLKRKPSPKDSLHPTKAEFIRAKHVNLSFILKPNPQQVDGDGSPVNLEQELSKQLHASVRSANLETSLRLLVQGADPNYFHEEKGSTPLQMAAKSGQASQIELLIVYGADLTAKDSKGNTAHEIAKQNKHTAIADRLVEATYEVTDRLTHFLCGKKPDHSTSSHLLIPDQGNSEISEQLKIARGKLQLVPNKMFQELVMDLYDEVDRRETEAIWATSALNPEIGAVPFLPTNPHLSATRNQGRQKLARFSPNEFMGLITDVLIDAKRRQNMAALRPLDGPSIEMSNAKPQHHHLERLSNLSDDEPLYDAVASDDDYAALTPLNKSATGSVVGQQQVTHAEPQQKQEVETLRRKLQDSFYEIDELKMLVKKLLTENCQLKSRIDSSVSAFDVPLRIDDVHTNGNGKSAECVGTDADTAETNESHLTTAYNKRPVSMYETREGLHAAKSQQNHDNRTANSMYQMVDGQPTQQPDGGIATASTNGTTLPHSDEVKHRTEVVTRRIQELWSVMQEMTANDVFVPGAERIRVAVAELTAVFPTTITNETIRNAIRQLNQNTGHLQKDCAGLQHSIQSNDTTSIDLYMQEVRNCAYNLAMATKMLVTQFQ
ncbi:ARF GTPase-activating protein Git [Sitodiplosis mosellana]|uniref:ARF GTPase-activating protein Git n=1 Tax=Sitodiplosis mosellana TaxID=263140 RepID=UPI0024440AD8|nr:ARF GTPase-activating protein Git [Sitodiplosis mosellana]XP_055309854.1 ARF GTPase-activating protein Git [Sitodiplosis mosellana]